MRHYEIVFLIHPDQSDQVNTMVDRYKQMIEDAQGKIHRFEDWGKRQLAYPINDLPKAHYILMNIEASAELLSELKNSFYYNDAILRELILNREHPVTEPSPMMSPRDDRRRRDNNNDQEAS